MMGRKRANGQGSVYQAGGIWRGACPIPNSEKRKYFSGATPKDVDDKIADFLYEVRHGRAVTSGQESLSHYLDRWFEDRVTTKGLKPGTMTSYRNSLRLIVPIIGSKPLQTLHPSHIQAAYARILEDHAPNTVRLAHRVLKQALKGAVEWDLIPRNPTDYVSQPKIRKIARRHLSRAEALHFLSTTSDDRLNPLWTTLLFTGMRIGEALALTWSDVDDTVIQVMAGGNGKTPDATREIPLLPEVRAALATRKQTEREEHVVTLEWTDSGRVFSRPTGEPMTSNDALVAFKRALKAAGLPDMRVHDLRHSFVSLCREAHIDLDVVQVLVGHADVGTTANIYGKVSNSRVREAASRLDGYMRGA